jgi:hypothetical protein
MWRHPAAERHGLLPTISHRSGSYGIPIDLARSPTTRLPRGTSTEPRARDLAPLPDGFARGGGGSGEMLVPC